MVWLRPAAPTMARSQGPVGRITGYKTVFHGVDVARSRRGGFDLYQRCRSRLLVAFRVCPAYQIFLWLASIVVLFFERWDFGSERRKGSLRFYTPVPLDH